MFVDIFKHGETILDPLLLAPHLQRFLLELQVGILQLLEQALLPHYKAFKVKFERLQRLLV